MLIDMISFTIGFKELTNLQTFFLSFVFFSLLELHMRYFQTGLALSAIAASALFFFGSVTLILHLSSITNVKPLLTQIMSTHIPSLLVNTFQFYLYLTLSLPIPLFHLYEVCKERNSHLFHLYF